MSYCYGAKRNASIIHSGVGFLVILMATQLDIYLIVLTRFTNVGKNSELIVDSEIS